MKAKRNSLTDKLLFSAISITFLIVVIIPLSYLSSELEKKIKNHEVSLLSTANANLVNEIANFQYDLFPTKYVERAMKSIIEAHLTNPRKINPKKFGQKCKKILENKYGIKPDILVCANKDFTTIYSHYLEKINASNKYAKARDYLYAICSIYVNYSLINKIANILKRQNNPHAAILKERVGNFHLFKKVKNILKLGNFANQFPLPETCRSYYSNELGHQHLFLYSHPIFRLDNKNRSIFYGTIIMGVTEGNISPKQMLTHVANKKLVNKINRIYNKKQFENINKDDLLIINSNLPTPYLNLLLTYKLINTQKYVNIKSDCRIGVALNKLFLKSNLRPLRLLTTFVIKCFILFTFFIWIKGLLFEIRLPLGLRRKFLLIVAFITVLPSLFIALFSFFIYQQIEAFHLNKGKAVISNNISKFERLKYEKNCRTVLSKLCKKKEYQKFFNNYSSSAFNSIRPKHMNNIGQPRQLVFDKYGNSKYLGNNKKPNPLLIMHGVTLLSNLGVLQKDTENIKKYIRMTSLTAGITSELFKIIEDHDIFTSESELTNSPIHAESMSKAIVQLFTYSKLNQNVCAIIFTTLTQYRFLDPFINKILESDYKLFDIKSDEYRGEVQLAINNLGSMQPEPILNRKISPILRNIFQTGLQTKISGRRMKTNETNKHLFEWRYKDDSRYMIAAHLELNHEKVLHIFFLLLPAYVGTLAMIILIIISEIMADLFTSQISTLHRASENIISNNNFLTKVSINTGDELEKMSDRFNKMTTSLQERQNISRFVSNKLISVLEENTNPSETIGEKLEVAVLSSDIRDFTTITETYKPEVVVNFLNEYFTIMEKAIISHGGVIDKFIGDAIIAIFYTDPKQNHVLRACNAAIEMREALAKYNNERQSLSLFTLENGIGIASGEVISGNVGSSDEYMEYTVIGQPIDDANDLEVASKSGMYTKIILDQRSAKIVSSHFTYNKIKKGLSSSIYEIQYKNE